MDRFESFKKASKTFSEKKTAFKAPTPPVVLDEQEQQEFLYWIAEKSGAVLSDGSVNNDALSAVLESLNEDDVTKLQDSFIEEKERSKRVEIFKKVIGA